MSTTSNCAEAQMRIRKPIEQVFDAFIDPDKTKNFWFTKGSSKLEKGITVTWEWEMYGIKTEVYVKDIIPNENISIEWGGNDKSLVDFNFVALSDGSTYVMIKQYGFSITGEALHEAIKDATGGFTTVVDGLKAYLEHGINLNLVGDKFPKEVMDHGAR